MEKEPTEETEEFTPEQETKFMQENIVGLEVTHAHFCHEHGLCIEFGDIWRLEEHGGRQYWFNRKVQ